jgi:hypothetical protein
MFSRGTIVRLQSPHKCADFVFIVHQHVASSNPKVQPVIDPHYFEQEIGQPGVDDVHPCILTSGLDLQILREILRFGKKVGDTAPLKDYFGISKPSSLIA